MKRNDGVCRRVLQSCRRRCRKKISAPQRPPISRTVCGIWLTVVSLQDEPSDLQRGIVKVWFFVFFVVFFYCSFPHRQQRALNITTTSFKVVMELKGEINFHLICIF